MFLGSNILFCFISINKLHTRKKTGKEIPQSSQLELLEGVWKTTMLQKTTTYHPTES